MASPKALTIDHLVTGYDGKPVLHDISFEVSSGEIVALLGQSGCGKSTLLSCLLGTKAPWEGSVTLLGQDPHTASRTALNQLRRRTGVLYQSGALFGSMSVGDNVAAPLRELSDLPESVIERVVAMKLQLVGLGGMQERLPSELSGGQQKRAAIARATAMDPEILLCDEPSAGLDPVVASGLDDVLLMVRRVFGTTIVVVTHELDSVEKIADRIVMLSKGHVVANGPLEELRKLDNPLVRDFLSRKPEVSDAQNSLWHSLDAS